MELQKHNIWAILLFCILLNIITASSIQYLFFGDSRIILQTYGQQLSSIRIAKIIEQSHKWQWLGNVFIPMVVLIRVGFTTICLFIGLFLVNLKVRLRDLFKTALIADFIFVLAGLVKLMVLIFIKEVNTLDDLQFQTLSLMEIFDKNEVDALFIYPISLINVFELLYWLALALLLSGVIDKPFGNSIKTVASSYGTGLLLWVLFVMFLTVNLN